MQLLKLNAQVLEEARQKQEALGLTVSQENVDAYKRYKAALNDVGDVMLAIKKTIGDALMPILTELGEWFASTGPQRVEFMRTAMKVLGTALNLAVAGFEQLMTVCLATTRTLYLSGMAVYEFFSKLAGGDFAGAGAAGCGGKSGLFWLARNFGTLRHRGAFGGRGCRWVAAGCGA